MLLKDLIRHTDVIEIAGSDKVEITSLTFDSRDVAAGGLFFAVAGSASDGHDYIDMAVSRGAVAVVCQRMPEAQVEGVTYIKVADSAAEVGRMASLFYDSPSGKLKLVGVTGTNGKTSIATLLYDMFRNLGYRAGLISTVTYRIGDRAVESTHTTPDAIRLNAMMAEMVEKGCDYCFMEVSSHSIVQERIAGLEFAGGIFTNITHEHLDYHGTFAEYIKAKKLFFDRLPKGAFALTNADDRNGNVMVQNTTANIKTYSLLSFADYKCRILETTPEGMLLELDSEQVWVKFFGKFNACNLTAVYGAARLLGASKSEALTALSVLTPVRGRFETIHSASGITAIIDYAHTPDALQNVIDTINDIRQGGGKLFIVVGCGGDRDKAKRPQMARIAIEGGDTAIFTSDNPRTEKAEDILTDMTSGLAGSGRWLTITDRAEAIKAAAMMAGKGDMILIAGKGHETYQIIGKEKRHFDDREEILRRFSETAN
jgi:UDP-N-acetylmuramoyl-L-alanyl-D-glutamate--2,6-diaminopimelate ligase